MIVKNKLNFKTIFFSKTTIPYWVILISSTLLILLVSKNSPMYILNDWVDVNAFFTMGKAWNHGLIPYRDLFEQKGPILYLIFLIASKISNNYFGIYIMECLFMFITSLIIFKIGKLFLPISNSLIFVFLIFIILTITPFFNLGGSAEEFSFVFVFYAIYLIFKLEINGFQISKIDYLFSGISMAIHFWIKYTFVGVWIGFYLSLAICLLIKKNNNELLKAIIYSLLGFLLITTPIIVYFTLNNSLSDLFFNYFYANISLYPSTMDTNMLTKILISISLFINKVYKNYILFTLFLIGFMGLLLSKKILKNNFVSFMYTSSYFSLIVTSLIGGKEYDYYLLIIFPFACIPLLLILINLQKASNVNILFFFLLCFSVIIGTNGTIKESKLFPNASSNGSHGSEGGPAQKKFAEIINKCKDPSLLNYGTLDLGLYTASDILPQNYYFHKVNIANEYLPEMMTEQNNIIRNREVEFVVSRMRYKDDIDKYIPSILLENYSLISKHNQFSDGGEYTYLLFKAK